jgi:hypothetical protein
MPKAHSGGQPPPQEAPATIPADLRDYLETLRALLDLEAGGWPALWVLTSLEDVLKEERPPLDREADFLRARLAELKRDLAKAGERR